MSAAACSSNGKCGVSEEVFRGTRVPQLAAAAVPVRPRNMGPASLTSAADFGKGSHPVSCLSLLSRPPEPAVEQAAAEKAASERSSSTTTAAEGPLSADACNSTSSDSAFLPTDQEHDLLRLSLAFTAARGSPSKAEFPRGAALSPSSSAAGKAPDMAALTAQLKCLDMQSGCGSASREHKDLKSVNVPLQLQPPLTSPQSNRQKESSVASVEASAWAQTPVKEEDLVASRAPDESRPPQEVPRSRNKSCASTPAGGAGKSRAGDTEDQVYRLGLLLRQLGRLGRVRSCWEIWQEMMNTEGLKPNAVSYGCIFDALVTNGALDLALKLLADMKASNQPVRPNTVMYSTLIKGCAQTKQLDQALSLFEEMAAQGVEINTVTYNSLLDVCARVGAMDRAASLLDDMLQKGVQPDLITFSTIIKGYCAHGQMDKGLLLLKAMKQKNINPDGVLYNSLLDGCVRSGRSSLCLELWQEMQAQRIKPSNFTLSILIKLHGRMRQLPVAFELVKQLPKMYDFRINAHVYTCLMAACIENRQYRAAYNVLQIMRREGVAADSKTVSTIVFGCLKGRMHAQAVEVVLNALETLRDANSRGPGRHPPRGRHANVGTNRKQDLPAIDEKTVRLLVYHLREQHMHHECTLVLDTAVSVGLMNRATAQSLLSGEGASGRRNPVISSAAPSGAFAPPQPLSRQQHVLANSPPVGACLTGIRGGQQQTNSHWNEARGVRRLPSGRQGGPAHRSSQGGAKEGQLFPAEGYLRFSTTQENTIGSVQPWYIDPPPSQTLSPDPVRPQAVNTLHSGAEGKQRPLTSHLQDPLQFHTAGLLGDLPMQHLLHLPINGSILTGGNAGDLSTSIAPSGQTLTLGASPYLTEEGISTQGAKLHSSLSVDLYGPGKVSESSCIWGAPAPGDTTPSATGCGLLAMPSAVACPPPHAVEVPSNSNALLGAGGPFFNEDYHLSELPLSSPGFPCEGSLQPSCTTAPLFQ